MKQRMGEGEKEKRREWEEGGGKRQKVTVAKLCNRLQRGVFVPPHGKLDFIFL